MMFKKPLRCHLDLLKPNIEETVQAQQIQQQLNYDIHSKDRLMTLCLLRILVMDLSG